MFRKNLPENEGMLFVFEREDYHGFWMMNMSFPIDIIWMDSGKKIVHIEKNLQPCRITCTSYKPNEKAMYVLEVNANFTDKHGIELGSVVKFSV